jgi:hypothetical protein
LRFVGILNAGFFGVPFAGSAYLDFATRAQIGNGLGELLGVGVELCNNVCLAGFDLGQLFFLIFS